MGILGYEGRAIGGEAAVLRVVLRFPMRAFPLSRFDCAPGDGNYVQKDSGQGIVIRG